MKQTDERRNIRVKSENIAFRSEQFELLEEKRNAERCNTTKLLARALMGSCEIKGRRRKKN